MAPIIKADPKTFNPVKFKYQVTTLDNAKYQITACEAWQNSADDPEQFGDSDYVRSQFKNTTLDSSCRWALYGLTAAQELQAEQQDERIAEYVKLLREMNRFHRQQLIDRYEDFKRWYEEDRELLMKKAPPRTP